MIKSRVGLFLMIVWIIEVKYVVNKQHQKKYICPDQPSRNQWPHFPFNQQHHQVTDIGGREQQPTHGITNDNDGGRKEVIVLAAGHGQHQPNQDANA